MEDGNMLLFLYSQLLFAEVPNVVLEQNAAEVATIVNSPIEKVTVFADRSLVQRKAKKRLSAGTHIVRFSDITGKIHPNSLRVEAKGGQIYRLNKELIEKSEYDLEELQNIIEKIETIKDNKKSLLEKKNRYNNEMIQIQNISPTPFLNEKNRNGPIVYDTTVWTKHSSYFSSQTTYLQNEIFEIDRNIETLSEELQALMIESQPLSQSNSKKTYEIIAVVKVPKEANVIFDISYFTPTSSWIPIYDIYYDSIQDSVKIEQSALFEQKSGEIWDDISIELSTAIPNRHLHLPKLQTWTLGEEAEYIPQAKQDTRKRTHLQSGLVGSYYQFSHDLRQMPTPKQSPTKVVKIPKIHLNDAYFTSLGFSDRFLAVYTGQIYIDNSTNKNFQLSSDDGSKLYINNRLIINNDGVHSMRAMNGSIYLEEGFHDIRIEFFENHGGNNLYLKWMNSNGQYTSVPTQVLFHDPTVSATGYQEPIKSLTKTQIKKRAELDVYREQVKHLNTLFKEQNVTLPPPQNFFATRSETSTEAPFSATGVLDSVGSGMGGGGYSEGLGSLGSKGRSMGKTSKRSASSPAPKRGPRVFAESNSIQFESEMEQDKGYTTDSDYLSTQIFGIEAENLYQEPKYISRSLPVAQAGGVVYNFKVPGKYTFPSNGGKQQIAIDAFQMVSTPYYETTPSLEELAYLKATLKHKGALPILQGNANIFLNGRFNTQGTLETTLQNGTLEVPLGADENIRIKRNIIPQQRTEGFLIGTQDITDYTIQIDIGNYKNKSIKIRVVDQIPKSNNDKISIGDIKSSHEFEKKPDADGILYWELDIPSQETEQITLNYSITRPKDWILWGKE